MFFQWMPFTIPGTGTFYNFIQPTASFLQTWCFIYLSIYLSLFSSFLFFFFWFLSELNLVDVAEGTISRRSSNNRTTHNRLSSKRQSSRRRTRVAAWNDEKGRDRGRSCPRSDAFLQILFVEGYIVQFCWGPLRWPFAIPRRFARRAYEKFPRTGILFLFFFFFFWLTFFRNRRIESNKHPRKEIKICC